MLPSPPGGALAEALRAAESAAADAASGAHSWDGARRRAALAALDRGIAALQGARADILLAERDSGSWRGAGDASFAAWRGRTTRAGRRAGAADERRADALAGLPAMREAVLEGQVTMTHVDVVGRTVAHASPAVRAALRTPEAQDRILDLARRLDAGRFVTALEQWSAAVDGAQLERTHQAQRAARHLHLADAADGTRVSGRLDRMAGHRLRLALEAFAPRPASDDDRTPEQRRADALEAMAEKVLGLPDTTPGAAVRPHVSLVMTVETWASLRAARALGDSSTGGGAERSADDVAPVTLEDGTPVPRSDVARALCDCELTRIVLDADSEPVDLGRTARTYTGTQRRGVLVRDGGCSWPGCEMPARWCEVHHMRWWDRDLGPTAVENGVALCSFHHHETHRRDLAVRRVRRPQPGPGERRVGYVFTARDGRVIAGEPAPDVGAARAGPPSGEGLQVAGPESAAPGPMSEPTPESRPPSPVTGPSRPPPRASAGVEQLALAV